MIGYLKKITGYRSFIIGIMLCLGCGFHTNHSTTQRRAEKSSSDISLWEGSFKGSYKNIVNQRMSPAHFLFRHFSRKVTIVMTHPSLQNQKWTIDVDSSKFSPNAMSVYSRINGTDFLCDLSLTLNELEITGTMKVFLRYGTTITPKETYELMLSKE